MLIGCLFLRWGITSNRADYNFLPKGKYISCTVGFSWCNLRKITGYLKFSYRPHEISKMENNIVIYLLSPSKADKEVTLLANEEMITVARRSLTFGLYSAFLALRAMVFRSSLQPRFTVDTMFLIVEENKSKKQRKTDY